MRILAIILSLLASPVLAQDAYHDSRASGVTIACFRSTDDELAGVKSAVRIVQRQIVNEEQVYDNNSLWDSNRTCSVQDGNRTFVSTAAEAQRAGIWFGERVGTVIWLEIPRADGQHDWIVRLQQIGYPAQQYKLRRDGQADKVVKAPDDIAWQPTRIYDAREWRLPRCSGNHLQMMAGFSNVKLRYMQGTTFGYGCDRVERRR